MFGKKYYTSVFFVSSFSGYTCYAPSLCAALKVLKALMQQDKFKYHQRAVNACRGPQIDSYEAG